MNDDWLISLIRCVFFSGDDIFITLETSIVYATIVKCEDLDIQWTLRRYGTLRQYITDIYCTSMSVLCDL